MIRILLISILLFSTSTLQAQSGYSVSYKWANLILEGIRNDYARPTVHARNLYHHSIISYDAWAAFDPSQETFFLGDTLHGYICPFSSIDYPADIQAAREEAISYASYHFMQNRYSSSPDYALTLDLMVDMMNQLGYDTSYHSTDYINEGPAALGNYLAEQIQLYGYTDGSNEINGFSNQYYQQTNPPLVMAQPGNPNIQDPNHWQPLTLTTSIDQSGNIVSSTPPHLSPEWGDVHPFAMDSTYYNEHTVNGNIFKVYFDTVHPAFLNQGDSANWDSFYKWNHSLVSVWQSHLNTTDGVMWDISPASVGNNTWYPSDSSQFAAFYDLQNGGDPSTGYSVNPVTGQPYTPQIVKRGDYARVLAEFWADGLDSETPPGHWFEIYHYVSHHPLFERKWKGAGPILDPLEYDVKAHLALGGTVHDAAIAAWSLKGYFDYIRPVSAIRFMCDQGQSSDTTELNYHPDGIPLLPGYIEVVHAGDSLQGQWGENIGKIKLYTWKGHDYIQDPTVDEAGVGWILGENWWPYQRPTFVTPPFAGFVSGHSTFSRAAAHTLEIITGTPYFPGGLGEFVAPMNEYLQFEEGPSDTIHLQWASYRDASDQCSLSRIWGGIHPPIDDIPGRKIGDIVGPKATYFADSIYNINRPAIISIVSSDTIINIADIGSTFNMAVTFNSAMDTSIAAQINLLTPGLNSALTVSQIYWVDSFNLTITFDVIGSNITILDTRIEISNTVNSNGQPLSAYIAKNYFLVDTKLPIPVTVILSDSVVNDNTTELNIQAVFDENCDTSVNPTLSFNAVNYINPTFTLNSSLSGWLNDSVYQFNYDVTDFNEDISNFTFDFTNFKDIHDNINNSTFVTSTLLVDTKNPIIVSRIISDTLLSQADLQSPSFVVEFTFDEFMDTTSVSNLSFEWNNMTYSTISQDNGQSYWIDSNVLHLSFLIYSNSNDLISLDGVGDYRDKNDNSISQSDLVSLLWSDFKSPEIVSATPSVNVINDNAVGTNNYTINLQFSEAMDTLIKPMIAHVASSTVSNSIQYNLNNSFFLDSFNYLANFQVIDENIEVFDIDLNSQFAQDYAGNTLNNFVATNFIDLDTKNPTVTNIYANTYVLNQLGESFDILVLFDELMNINVHPTLTIAPSILSPLTLDKVDSNWLSNSSYEFNYQLIGNQYQNQLFDISLTTATDLAGNSLVTYQNNEFFTISEVLSLSELNELDYLLYPSIVSSGDKVYIKSNTELDNSNFYVINSVGQIIHNIEFTSLGDTLISDELTLPAGMYFVTNGLVDFKIVIQ